MKKVKIMLMSALVIAVVGGALAFKAKSEGWYCGTTLNNCPTFDNQLKYKITDEGHAYTDKFCTNDPQGITDCTFITKE